MKKYQSVAAAFSEKASNGISTLYSLTDFVDEDGVKIRKDENYEKNYLLGKYGAIPKMQRLLHQFLIICDFS